MTKDEILTRLAAAYTGPGSAEEGTFAGDVLRACADGMAQLWSMDIDGLERRAFVSSAEGEWLTAVCADRGIRRREGETDEELRQRALAALAATPASGNADHYAAWCTQAVGIDRVRVLPLARGSGTVDIVAAGTDGRAPGAEAVAAAQSIVDRERPVGADARVFAAEETPVSVTAAVTLMDGGELGGVQAAFSKAVDAFFQETALRTSTVSHAKLLRLLLETDGVADVTAFSMNGSGESLPLSSRAVAVMGTLTLTET